MGYQVPLLLLRLVDWLQLSRFHVCVNLGRLLIWLQITRITRRSWAAVQAKVQHSLCFSDYNICSKILLKLANTKYGKLTIMHITIICQLVGLVNVLRRIVQESGQSALGTPVSPMVSPMLSLTRDETPYSANATLAKWTCWAIGNIVQVDYCANFVTQNLLKFVLYFQTFLQNQKRFILHIGSNTTSIFSI